MKEQKMGWKEKALNMSAISIVSLLLITGLGAAATVTVLTDAFTAETEVDQAFEWDVEGDEHHQIYQGETVEVESTIINNADAWQDTVYETVTVSYDEDDMTEETLREVYWSYELLEGGESDEDEAEDLPVFDEDESPDNVNYEFQDGDLVIVIEAGGQEDGNAVFGPEAEFDKDFDFEFATAADTEGDYTMDFSLETEDPLEG